MVLEEDILKLSGGGVFAVCCVVVVVLLLLCCVTVEPPNSGHNWVSILSFVASFRGYLIHVSFIGRSVLFRSVLYRRFSLCYCCVVDISASTFLC